MFTLGVISTLLMALAVISVKNLAIGVVLLIVAVSQVNSFLYYLIIYMYNAVHILLDIYKLNKLIFQLFLLHGTF